MAQGGVIVIPSGIASRSRSFGIRDAMKRGISGVALGGWFCLLPFAFCLLPSNYGPIITVGQPITITPPCMVLSLMRAAIR